MGHPKNPNAGWKPFETPLDKLRASRPALRKGNSRFLVAAKERPLLGMTATKVRAMGNKTQRKSPRAAKTGAPWATRTHP
jgi:hypothetical protein